MSAPPMSRAGRASTLAATLVLAATLGAAGPGCGRDSAPPKGKAAPAAVAAREIAIFLDQRQVASVVDLGGEPRALTGVVAGLPPIDQWLALELVDSAGKVHTTMAPAQNQPGKVPAIAAGADGVEVGFRSPGATGPLVDPIRHVTRVTIKAKGDAGQIAAQAANADRGGGDSGGNREHADEARPTPGADLTIQITGAAGESTFTGDRFESLRVIKAPVGDTETPGWSLLDVLAEAGISDPQVVHLTDGEGATLRLEPADFDPARTVLYLKLNRSGVLRFRVFRKKGDVWEVGGELRGITKIHVVK